SFPYTTLFRSWSAISAGSLVCEGCYGRARMPPVSGRGTPVVAGKGGGKTLSVRAAREAKDRASSASADQPTAGGGCVCGGGGGGAPACASGWCWVGPPRAHPAPLGGAAARSLRRRPTRR